MDYLTLKEIASITGLSEAAARSRIRRYVAALPTDRRPAAVKQQGGGKVSLYSKALCVELFGNAFNVTDRDRLRPAEAEQVTDRKDAELLQAKYRHLLSITTIQAKELELLKVQVQATGQALNDAKDRERFYMQTIDRQQQQLGVYSVKLLQVKETPIQAKQVSWAVYAAGLVIILISVALVLYFANY